MTATYEKIATTTLGSAAANVEFTSITGSYTDLILVINGGFSANGAMVVRVNSDTGSNFSTTLINGDGSSAISFRSSNTAGKIYMNYNAITGNSFSGVWLINFQNYANTTTYKTILGRYNGASNEVGASVGLWRSTSAINTIRVFENGGANLLSGSTFTIYGIKSE